MWRTRLLNACVLGLARTHQLQPEWDRVRLLNVLLSHIWCLQEMEKIGNQRFVVVYFNADTHMGLFPNNTFFLDAHSALRPSHRRQMKVGHCSLCQHVHVHLRGSPAAMSMLLQLHPCRAGILPS